MVVLPRVRAGELIKAEDFNRLAEAIERSMRFTGSGALIAQGPEGTNIQIPLNDDLAIFQLNEDIGPESSSDFANRTATRMVYRKDDDEWTPAETDENEESIVTSPYGDLIWDEGDRCVCWFDRQSGKRIPLQIRTVRHAITCADDDGHYPSSSENPDTYPIKFVRLEYDEAAGFQGHTLEYLQPEDDGPDDFVHNIAETEPNTYIPECCLLLVYHVTDQWFCFVDNGNDFEGCSSSSSQGSSHSSESSSQGSSLSSSLSSSSASSLSSSSTSSLSSSSLSSLSSSSNSSSRSSSLSSSQHSSLSSSGGSSGSSSQGSSASSGGSSASSRGSSASSGGSSASSGGSSASSDLSSGGSGASSDQSSGGSSASSQPSSECTETHTFVTSLNFDSDTCVLSYCTKSLTWPCDLGITAGAENC